MARKKYTPSEKWEMRHGQAYSRWIVVKYIILFVIIVLMGVFTGMQTFELLQRLGCAQNIAWIAAAGIPLVAIAFVYFGIFFPIRRDSKSLYRYANDLEEKAKALEAEVEKLKTAEQPPQPPLPEP